jgi:hypothetical protein
MNIRRFRALHAAGASYAVIAHECGTSAIEQSPPRRGRVAATVVPPTRQAGVGALFAGVAQLAGDNRAAAQNHRTAPT